MENENQVVLLYYRYVRIEEPHRFAADHRRLALSLGLTGRIIVAEEGINGTVAGSVVAARAYREALRQDPRFAEMPCKESAGDVDTFPKLSIKVRSEIVTLGLPLPFDPARDSAPHLPPADWKRLAESDPDAVLFDARNDYESAVGRFRGAITPPIGNFRELPEAIDAYKHLKDKKILMYCTGGIRCEKASALLRQNGFREVYQLDGGIMNYARELGNEDELWEGDCFVFDNRLVLPIATAGGRPPAGRCAHSGRPTSHYRNCLHNPCNRLFLVEERFLDDNPQAQLCPQCLQSGLTLDSAVNKSRRPHLTPLSRQSPTPAS